MSISEGSLGKSFFHRLEETDYYVIMLLSAWLVHLAITVSDACEPPSVPGGGECETQAGGLGRL